MLKLLKKLSKLHLHLLISIIELLEDVIIYYDTRSYHIDKYGYFVDINKDVNSKITHIHYTGKKSLYKITTCTGKTLSATAEHILPVHVKRLWSNSSEYFTVERLNRCLRESSFKYYLTNSMGRYEHVKSIEKIKGKHKVFDITISDKLHIFLADGLLVHNCVTSDTDVDILNKKIAEFEKIPIFELYYGNMESKTLLMKLEYWLHKMIYKINKKTKG